MKFGSCAIGIYESGQGRNAAAIRRISYVPQGCLAELTAKVTCISSPTYRIFLYVGEHSVRMRTARVIGNKFLWKMPLTRPRSARNFACKIPYYIQDFLVCMGIVFGEKRYAM